MLPLTSFAKTSYTNFHFCIFVWWKRTWVLLHVHFCVFVWWNWTWSTSPWSLLCICLVKMNVEYFSMIIFVFLFDENERGVLLHDHFCIFVWWKWTWSTSPWSFLCICLVKMNVEYFSMIILYFCLVKMKVEYFSMIIFVFLFGENERGVLLHDHFCVFVWWKWKWSTFPCSFFCFVWWKWTCRTSPWSFLCFCLVKMNV